MEMHLYVYLINNYYLFDFILLVVSQFCLTFQFQWKLLVSYVNLQFSF